MEEIYIIFLVPPVTKYPLYDPKEARPFQVSSPIISKYNAITLQHSPTDLLHSLQGKVP